MDLGVSGLASGFDWKTLVDQMIDVQRAPERTTETPWRTGAADHPRIERIGRSLVVKM